ncbi:MAG: MFS transporter [Candidatus Omnitrophica bacterium]|jgi:MFS family permease|nr:MFS transporter [Candidatus Omnitrophota bacterium]
MARLRDVLREPDFLFLWLGQVISQFGDKLTMMALVGLVTDKAPGSAYEIAKLFTFIIIPVFIVGPIAGVYSDRWSRKWTMIISDCVRGLLVLSIALYWIFMPATKPIFPVYIVVFLIFTVTRFFIPAKMAIVPELLTEDKLLKGNSLIHITGMIASALGFGLGGIMISLPFIGLKGGFIIDSTTFFLSALLLSCVSSPGKAAVSKKTAGLPGKDMVRLPAKSVLCDIKCGIKHIIDQPKMHFVTVLLFILASGVGASQVVLIVFIQDYLASLTRDLGLLIMFFGIGLFAGAIVYGKFGDKLSKIRVVLLSLLLGGVFLLQFLVLVRMFSNFALAAVITFFFGAAISPIIISSNTMVHELVPEDAHGKVFSSLEAVIHLAYLIFMFISAILAEIAGTFNILLIIGIAFILVGLIGIRRTKIA